MICMLNILSTDTSCVLAHFLQYRKHDMYAEYPSNKHNFLLVDTSCVLARFIEYRKHDMHAEYPFN